MKKYEPKEGSGWQEYPFQRADDPSRTWRRLVTEGIFLVVSAEGAQFTISRVSWVEPLEHSAPSFGDMGRIQEDFGVHAWSIQKVAMAPGRHRGWLLHTKAIEPNETPQPLTSLN